jgi:hypothetical protein
VKAVLIVDWLNTRNRLDDRNRLPADTASVMRKLIDLARDRARDLYHAESFEAWFVSEGFTTHEDRELVVMLAKQLRVATTKEQADVAIAVKAMDLLHDAAGDYRVFMISTADQDFLPLVQRLTEAGRQVEVLADLTAFAPHARHALADDLAATLVDLIPLFPEIEEPPPSNELLSYFGLLRLAYYGYHLGPDNPAADKANKLREWGFAVDVQEAGQVLQAAVRHLCVERTDERALRRGGVWQNRRQPRHFLRLNGEQDLANVVGADFILRAASAREFINQGMLRFAPDAPFDQARRAEILNALRGGGWLNSTGDRFQLGEERTTHGRGGLLGPLWLVACTLQEAWQPLRDDQLFKRLQSRPYVLGYGDTNGRKAGNAMRFAQAIDLVKPLCERGQDEPCYHLTLNNPVMGLLTRKYRAVGSHFAHHGWLGSPQPYKSIMDSLEAADRGATEPLFGHTLEDRKFFLKLLSASRLAEYREEDRDHPNWRTATFTLRESEWLKTLL